MVVAECQNIQTNKDKTKFWGFFYSVIVDNLNKNPKKISFKLSTNKIDRTFTTVKPYANYLPMLSFLTYVSHCRERKN